jgi:AhpD family alkylhydroperoxidase
LFVIAALAGAQLATAGPAPKPAPPVVTAVPPPTNEATFKDIQTTLGFVPAFIRSAPPTLLPAIWQTMKSFQLSTETKLDGKTKELIGLAVAAQIPCEYCIQFHTEAAKLNGASDQEIQEAVGMAAVTREMSTMLNGMQVDKVQFKKDLDRLVQSKKQQAKR